MSCPHPANGKRAKQGPGDPALRVRHAAAPAGAGNAREIALAVLTRCAAPTPVQAALDAALRAAKPSSRDAALTTELSYGCLRAEIKLSYLLGLVLPAPDRLPPVMLLMLKLAAYEVLFLHKVPDHAAVNAAVTAVRSRWGKGLAGVANGALRSLIRLRPELSPAFFAARFPDPAERLAAEHSLPVWIAELWLRAYGIEQAERLAIASARSPRLCVRINALRPEAPRLRERLLTAGGVPVGSWGVRVAPGFGMDELSGLQQQGLLSFQGSGSLEIVEALDAAHWESPFWDACAGRGGKTCALMERGLRLLAASDTSLRRLTGLRKEIRRLGLASAPLFSGSAAQAPFAFERRPETAPRTVLLDVPCSGLGTLARKPDLRRLRKPEHLPSLYQLQAAMLEEAWRIVAPGGRIAYLTCAVNPDENEKRIAAFLAAHPQAVLLRQHQPKPGDCGADMLFGALIEKKTSLA